MKPLIVTDNHYHINMLCIPSNWQNHTRGC